jgi:DNA-binding MarR family transcriptional regulator
MSGATHDSHPTNGLDEVVHQRARLGILAMLVEADKVEFGLIQQTLELTAGNLSRHLTTLEAANLVHIEKGYDGRRPRTWARITPAGRKALKKEVQALRDLVTRLRDL